ncbi:hypothetical protein H8K52_05245 [Undibacterium seohonense]|uniref:Uncharacterized protein n=1 Tax=Undibacterium seohonense TaxID=1344950 RepID=A0ABR6X1M0_9BURK|nr:hypothetical protein [Undibacterium seohonense]MBC3806751.1 hypothetical protein [Undibacterium seohonense]
MTWTFEDGLRFECARDLMTAMIGISSGKIAEEMQKINPDQELIQKLKADSFSFARRRESFHVHDKEKIESIFSEFTEVVRQAYTLQLTDSVAETCDHIEGQLSEKIN